MNQKLKSLILNRITVDENGCWIWSKAQRGNGYGAIKINHKVLSAHRVSWLAFKGEIPDGIELCHKCDVRACVNPDHLFLGTRSDNMKDAYDKGRLKIKRTLDDETVRKIKALINQPGSSCKQIAADFGISKYKVYDIKYQRGYANVI